MLRSVPQRVHLRLNVHMCLTSGGYRTHQIYQGRWLESGLVFGWISQLFYVLQYMKKRLAGQISTIFPVQKLKGRTAQVGF